jgi:very-short-patch-repair endonuclease
MTRKSDQPRRVVTRRELLASGKTKAAIEYAVRDRRLFVVHTGVYAVGHPRLTDEERWLAAVLACGQGALLDARSAAEHRGLLASRGGPPHVLVTDRRRIRRPGIVIHRSRHIEGGDEGGIPTVSLRRMFVSLGATESQRTLRRALRQAEYEQLIDPAGLADSLVDAVPGTARLRAMLAHYATTGLTESGPEDDLLALCRRYRISPPVSQFALGPYRYDFAWPTARLLLEVDEYDGHHQATAIAEDNAKDRYAIDRGYLPLRALDSELRTRAPAIAHTLRSALDARSLGRFSS